ncbi:MAG: chorion class high-cysteine HCB protein 13 [Lachnospiraceae bacterium]|nr:chorion class high-cysteine HCB protein 13 [Lachnospiraceae bacterium]
MSDLTASQCGCGNDNNGCGNLIWLILLLSICGNNGNGCGCNGTSLFGGNGNGSCCESLIFILLILSCCGNN